MENRVAVISIIVKEKASSKMVNDLLHQYGDYVVARMGVPYEKRKVSLISVIVDAPQPTIAALSGKLGALYGVSSKTLYSNLNGDQNEV